MKTPRYRLASINGCRKQRDSDSFYWVADDWYCGKEVTRPTTNRKYHERIRAEYEARHLLILSFARVEE